MTTRQFPRPAAVVLAHVLATAMAIAATTREFALDSLRLAGCEIRDGQVTLGDWFDPGASPVLAMEAEDAVGLIADPAAGVDDPACSGGRCVSKVDRALFPIRVASAGRYQRWSLGYFPQGGGWVHSESLDDAPPQWVTDCDGSTAGRWVWVKGPVYELTAGVHLLWIHNWHGGARLDKVILAREGEAPPDGLGPQAVRRAPALEGWALTPAITVPGLRSLREVPWPFEARGGEVSVALSIDGGASFQPVSAAAVALASGDSAPVPRLQLRATLRRAGPGPGPVLASPSLVYETAPEAFIALEDEAVRAVFLKATGGLVELLDRRNGVSCITGADGAPSFTLSHLPVGAETPVALPPESMRLLSLESRAARLTARYQVAEEIRAELTVSLTGGELTWDLDLDNRSGLDLVQVTCPAVSGVRLGDRVADDLLITPNWQGGLEIADPAHSGGGRVPYPCGGGMAWLDLYEREPAHGLYLASHDRGLTGSLLAATPGVDGATLTFGVTRHLHIRPREAGSAPRAVLGVHAGDWHVAADAYRSWGRTWMRTPQSPEWVRDADGWLGLVVSADASRVPFRRLPEYLGPMRDLGTPYIQVWGQMTGGSNCDSLPYPNPVLGSLDEFTEAVRAVRRGGGHITFYVSSQFWKPAWGDAEMLGSTPRSLLPPTCPIWDWTEWRHYAIRSYAGECSGDTPFSDADKARYGTPFFRTVPCPFTKAWAEDHLYRWCVERYGKDYGASGIYLDETNAASERFCFAANHGHDQHGIWGASLTRAVAKMVRDGRRRDRDWIFAMEGCSDATGQFADVHLISPASARQAGLWGATKRFAPEVFHYTFPEYILYDGVANGVYGGIPTEDVFLNVHLHGNRYDTFSVQPAARYVALRQRTKQLLYRARFMDDLGLRVSDPAVRAKINVLDDSHNRVRLVNLANPGLIPSATVRVTLPPGDDPWTAYYFDLEGGLGPLPLARDGAGGRFTAPASRASTVLLASSCEPLLQVPVTSLTPDDAGEAIVTVVNPSGRERRGQLRIDVRGVEVVGTLPLLTLAPQSTQQVVVPVSVPAGIPGTALCGTVRLAGKGVAVRRPMEVLVVSALHVSGRLRKDTVEIVLKNLSSAPRRGTVTAQGKPWSAPQSTGYEVMASATTTVSLPCGPGLLLDEPTEVTIRVSGGGPVAHALWIGPRLQNPGFERADAGGKPAGWQMQNAPQIAVENENPAVGKACLRLIGKPGTFVEAHQALDLEPGEKATVRCQVRRTPGTARTLGPTVVVFAKTGGEKYLPLSKVTAAPDDQWNDYAATVTADPEARALMLYLYNVDSAATAWFDDVRVSDGAVVLPQVP